MRLLHSGRVMCGSDVSNRNWGVAALVTLVARVVPGAGMADSAHSAATGGVRRVGTRVVVVPA